jgi:hypothetical protein
VRQGVQVVKVLLDGRVLVQEVVALHRDQQFRRPKCGSVEYKYIFCS